MKTIAVLIMGLWAVSWAEAQEPVATADQMLPLAVGNSWRYLHDYLNFETGDDFYIDDVTIRITHTEDIEGHTYYVFSPMPYEHPPVLSFFPAGQKVRFDGDTLVFLGREGDIPLYQFKSGGYSYPIPETESDTLVVVDERYRSYRTMVFEFRGHDRDIPETFVNSDGYPTYSPYYFERRHMRFTRGLGIETLSVKGMHANEHSSNDEYHLIHHLLLRSATINGEERDPETFRYPYTVVRETSWGALKRTFAHPDEEE